MKRSDPVTDDDYYTIRSPESLTGRAGRPSPLRAAALFATLAVAVTLLTLPQVDKVQRYAGQGAFALDPVVTGSIRSGNPGRKPMADQSGGRDGRTYVVRRSVLTGGSVCILGTDGSRNGAC